MEMAMDNRINEIRRLIRALRVSMLEAEAVMRDQISRDEKCSFVAQEIMKIAAQRVPDSGREEGICGICGICA